MTEQQTRPAHPRVLQGLPDELISTGERSRLLAGALEVVVARRYRTTSVADIIAAAQRAIAAVR